MPDNRVRDVFTARIKQLMSQYEESEAVSHPDTVGAMREQYLKSFLRELLPPKFSPVSGFVADMYGHITPQLDMIFIDRSELPTLSLVHDTAIVPYEIVLLIAEVKSTLDGCDLEQIRKQREAIEEMRSKFLMASESPNGPQVRTRCNKVGMMVMAFESKVGEATLEQWVRVEMNEPASICILNPKGKTLSIFHQVIGKECPVEKHKATLCSDYDPLLTFVGAIYRHLYLLLLNNSPISDQELQRYRDSHAMWLWEGYLSESLWKHVQKFQSPM